MDGWDLVRSDQAGINSQSQNETLAIPCSLSQTSAPPICHLRAAAPYFVLLVVHRGRIASWPLPAAHQDLTWSHPWWRRQLHRRRRAEWPFSSATEEHGGWPPRWWCLWCWLLVASSAMVSWAPEGGSSGDEAAPASTTQIHIGEDLICTRRSGFFIQKLESIDGSGKICRGFMASS